MLQKAYFKAVCTDCGNVNVLESLMASFNVLMELLNDVPLTNTS